ncbi:S8 family serine peptidase [uncultured Mucilaginibacter sp.]|uniref:S8 family serine peptidase n=1 Tax=uncultured Mucilaginibacter sp. TaxID=797541 RepID=UPI002617720D|nr:S8 family serine peptidase [uncultured Mucilaginibacter sp.]
MIKNFTCFIFFFITLKALPGFAQFVGEDKRKELISFSGRLKTDFESNRTKAFALAKVKGWPVLRRQKDGRIVSLQGVDALGFPIYLQTNNNIIAAATTQTTAVYSGGSLGLNLSGSSAFMGSKLGIWDEGKIYPNHQEFVGKTVTMLDNSATVSEHSTHVAGTLIAKGVYAPARGMAFGANGLIAYDFNNDASEMAAAAVNLLVSNHSYGIVTGWSYNTSVTPNRWEWYGLPGDNKDYKFGYYSAYAQSFDRIAYNAPYYLITVAAGNARGETGPAVGATYYGYQSRTDQTIVNKGARPASLSSNDGYDIMDAPSLAKNVLAVGAINPLPFGPASSSDISIAYFSSWGPTDDGRIKPDICGDGVNVTSTGYTAPDAYEALSGTSMASPNVAGSVFLLQEYYAQKSSGSFLRAATLKGLVCHTAFDAGNIGPDYIYGWGLLNMAKAAQAITDNGTKSIISENSLAQGQTQTFNVVSSGNGPLVATISWTDPEATVGPTGVVDDPAIKLVNDLDIRINQNTTLFKPWVLDPANPATAATTGDNSRDNIEQVYIANTVPGKSYTITVNHKGTLSRGLQAYSLIITGVGGKVYCASAANSTADSKINQVQFAGINYTAAAGCTSYTDNTGLTATLEQGATFPFNVTLGTCGGNFNKIAKVFIDWNADGDFDDAGELVATSPITNGNASFTGNILVPVSVTPDTYSLMRIVETETSDPNAVTACGTYAKGETQDYRVNFVRSTKDAGVASILSPSVSGTCSNNAEQISIRLHNYGSATISNVPVTVNITNANGSVTTINETFTGTILPSQEQDFTLNTTFNAQAGTAYQIVATTNLAGDTQSSNNQSAETATINTAPVLNNLLAVNCANTNSYLLTGNGDGTVFWYANAADALPFASGPSVNTSQAPINNTYYASLNDLTGKVGPATKNVFSAGGYNQFGPGMNITTTVPVILQSARLYIGYPGMITFTATNTSGQTVSSVTLNVAATRSNPQTGAQVDDPTDVGRVYQLNLLLPAAGSYTINISYADNATIYRNNGGVTGYPFTIGNFFSLTGTNASTTPQAYYYYFYDLTVKSAGCAAAARVAVPVTKPQITQNAATLTSNFANGNQWYLNNTLIQGATNQTYQPKVAGTYRVDVTTSAGCISPSADFNFALPAGESPLTDINLVIYPVPTNNVLNLSFELYQKGDLQYSVWNSIGQLMYQNNSAITVFGRYNSSINTSNMASGNYILRIRIGSKNYSKKFVITKG